MTILYVMLAFAGIISTWRVFKLVKKRRRFSTKSLSKNPLFQALKTMHELMADEESIDGKVPGGFGEFGYSSSNPIPVNGIMGEINYLARLRTIEGVKVEYERLGQAAARNINNPIDIYEIRANGEYLCKLFLSPYYKEISDLSPDGFGLTPKL